MLNINDVPENDSTFDPPGGDLWDEFENQGDLVTVSGGPQKDDMASYLAYSTLMAEWLRTPRSRLLSFVRHSSCSPDQALAMDRHIHWFEWEFNCFARNRRGIIKATKQIIASIVAEADEQDEEEETDGKYRKEVDDALEQANKHNSAKGRQRIIERRPIAGLSRGTVEHTQKEWEEEGQIMRGCDEAVSLMPDRARHAYGNAKYMSWVESTIADDLQRGLPVDEYDVTEIKDMMRSNPKMRLDEIADYLPMSWEKSFQISEMSLSSGHETRNTGLQALTGGTGYVPEPRASKGWRSLFGRRKPNPPPAPASIANPGVPQRPE